MSGTYYYITAKYSYLYPEVARKILPLCIAFKENNHVTFKLDSKLTEQQRHSFIVLAGKYWFKDLIVTETIEKHESNE